MHIVSYIAGRTKGTCKFIFAALLLVCFLPFPAEANERQHKVEAAFLYNFFNYITWPNYDSPQALQEPVICVYGKDPIIDYLEYVRFKMTAERTITVRVIGADEKATGCHILFVRHAISPAILESLTGSTLTVFKPDDPLDRGGMIELVEDEERISIKINQSELEEHGFQASSRLLDLAQRAR